MGPAGQAAAEGHHLLSSITNASLVFRPLTPERWEDFEHLFGPQGAYGGCWCMWWRTTRARFGQQQGEGNRQALKNRVDSGEAPGILAYHEGEPVGWCAVAPRESFDSLNRSRVLKKLDDTPVWSIVCFYVPRQHRGEGLLYELIRGAIDYVAQQGGKVIEAYPSVSREERQPPVNIFMGLPQVFTELGFVEVARPSLAKVVMRYYL